LLISCDRQDGGKREGATGEGRGSRGKKNSARRDRFSFWPEEKGGETKESNLRQKVKNTNEDKSADGHYKT